MKLYTDVDLDFLFSQIGEYPICEDHLCVINTNKDEHNCSVTFQYTDKGLPIVVYITANYIIPEYVISVSSDHCKFIRPGNSDVYQFMKDHIDTFEIMKKNFDVAEKMDF